VNLTGLLLIFLGVGMLISEAFVTSYGILGLGGVTAFVIGLAVSDRHFEDRPGSLSHNIIYGAAAAADADHPRQSGTSWRASVATARLPARKASSARSAKCAKAIAPGAPGKVLCMARYGAQSAPTRSAPGARARVQVVSKRFGTAGAEGGVSAGRWRRVSTSLAR